MQLITYRNISAWEEHNFFFKGLLLSSTSNDVTLIFWEKSNNLKAHFSTVREISFLYISGGLNSEVLSHCLKSQSLLKKPKSKFQLLLFNLESNFPLVFS